MRFNTLVTSPNSKLPALPPPPKKSTHTCMFFMYWYCQLLFSSLVFHFISILFDLEFIMLSCAAAYMFLHKSLCYSILFKTIITQEAKYCVSQVRFKEFQNGSSMVICDCQQFKTYHDSQVLAQISSFELFHHGSTSLVYFCFQHSKRKWF